MPPILGDNLKPVLEKVEAEEKDTIVIGSNLKQDSEVLGILRNYEGPQRLMPDPLP